MVTDLHRFVPGIALTFLLGVLSILLTRLPIAENLGALSLALLLGMGWRGVQTASPIQNDGITFSARTLLRVGIIILGVQLNFAQIGQVGPKILFLAASVITTGLIGISWLGRRLGLDPALACLIAMDSSICGGSAAAASAPVIRAKDEDVALVIPLCSLIGTVAMLLLTLVQHHHRLPPTQYGLIAGATLHEVAQVMAAVGPFPEAAETGTIVKLTRVVLLFPALLVVGWIFARDRNRKTANNHASAPDQAIPKPWFVLGFLLVGISHTGAQHLFPEHMDLIVPLKEKLLVGANFLMAMSMAAMGLQMDISRLRANGAGSIATALLGWLLLAGLTILAVHFFNAPNGLNL